MHYNGGVGGVGGKQKSYTKYAARAASSMVSREQPLGYKSYLLFLLLSVQDTVCHKTWEYVTERRGTEMAS